MTETPEPPRSAQPRPADVRRGRGRAAVALARDQARAVPGPHPRVHRAAGGPAARLSGDPPHRHQRQDLDLPDDRHAARAPSTCAPALHQPAPGEDHRADLPRRRAARRRGLRARLQRRRALHPPRRRVQPYPLSFFETVVGMAYAAFADAPVDAAVVEVGMGGTWDATNVADGAVAVGARRSRWTTPQYLGDIARRRSPSRRPGSSSPARRRSRRADPRRRRGAAARARRGRRHRRRARASTSGWPPGSPRSGARSSRCRGCAAATTTCSCPSTAPTRRRTPSSRWRPSRPSSAGTSRSTADVVRAAFAGGHLARPARGHPPQPDDRARRGAQPPRGRGDWRRAGGLVRRSTRSSA